MKSPKIKRAIKITLFLIFLAACVEITAKNLDRILPLEVQQRYANINYYTKSSYITNGRGARGMWPKKDRVQIAVVGSSILAMNHLADSETWTSLLENDKDLNIHIDNYGVGFNKVETALEILDYIEKNQFYYDIIIVNMAPETIVYKRESYLSNTFHSRWVKAHYATCATCDLIKSFFERRAGEEKKFWTFLPVDLLLKRNRSSEKALLLNKSTYDTQLYQWARSSGRLVPTPPLTISEEDLKKAEDKTRKLFLRALAIAPKVLWMPESIAYHPNMLPSYLNKYLWLLPRYDWETSGMYIDAASMNARFVFYNDFARKLVKDLPVEEISWDHEMREKLPYVENLFLDEFHLSPTGSLEVYNIIKPKLSVILKRYQNRK